MAAVGGHHLDGRGAGRRLEDDAVELAPVGELDVVDLGPGAPCGAAAPGEVARERRLMELVETQPADEPRIGTKDECGIGDAVARGTLVVPEQTGAPLRWRLLGVSTASAGWIGIGRPAARSRAGALSRSEPERRVDLARLVNQRARSKPMRWGLMEVLPASPRLPGVVFRASLRDAVERREAGFRSVRGAEEGHPQAVPIGPVGS
jgi:hypothetical protein